MSSTWRYAAAWALLSAAIACGDRGPPAPASASASVRAPATAEADEICEHGLQKSICTKCNPALAPIFKDKGDWCKEHDFPESVCPICHPERGGRPSMDTTAKADTNPPPADKTKIRFKSVAIAENAGIATVDAMVTSSTVALTVPAVVVYDATKMAHVKARAPGVISAVAVDLGAKVKKGDKLATLQSAQVGADRSKLAAAAARVKAAEDELKRKRELQADGITTRTAVVEAERELAEAQGELNALSASVSVVGKSAPGVGGYVVEAPLDGVVTMREATVGEVVELNGALFDIVDLSRVWVELSVPENQLSLTPIGKTITVTFDALDGRVMQAPIEFIAAEIDPRTRTAKVRASLENKDGQLRLNMFGKARLLGKAKTSVVVPRSAVQRTRGQAMVFVKLAPDVFEARHVEVGQPTEDGGLEILSGVEVAEPVVTTGSFLLKTETLKESIGAGCCEVD